MFSICVLLIITVYFSLCLYVLELYTNVGSPEHPIKYHNLWVFKKDLDIEDTVLHFLTKISLIILYFLDTDN